MSRFIRSLRRSGKLLTTLAAKMLTYKGLGGVWIDVGAHLGEKTFEFAQENPALMVYAFEPNLRVAAKRMGILPNFVMIPMAVGESNGCSSFYINAFDASSSILPLNEKGIEQWIGGESLRVESVVQVPVIRLDTFMGLLGISEVDFLKVDAQGADFSVVKSAGNMLKLIHRITLEVATTPIQPYIGAASKYEIVEYMLKAGFDLANCEAQSHDQEENLTFVNVSTAGGKQGFRPGRASPAWG
jgi:FkbM family methyltransferase